MIYHYFNVYLHIAGYLPTSFEGYYIWKFSDLIIEMGHRNTAKIIHEFSSIFYKMANYSNYLKWNGGIYILVSAPVN